MSNVKRGERKMEKQKNMSSKFSSLKKKWVLIVLLVLVVSISIAETDINCL